MTDDLRDTIWQAVRKAISAKSMFMSEDEVAMAITDDVMVALAPMFDAHAVVGPPEPNDALHIPQPQMVRYTGSLTEQDVALREFFKWAMREGPWSGCDLDAGDIEEKAEELQLIVREDYDHAKHGGVHRDSPDITEGDDWYIFAPGIA